MEGTSALFELELSLPDSRLKLQGERLIGFQERYRRIEQVLRLLIDKDGLEAWSKKHYHSRLSLLDSLADRYPLVVFYGDVGTGKTATAEAACNALARSLGKDAHLFKLSTRVRGGGNVGEMSTQINQAFDIVGKEAGKARLSFLIIDEADSLAANRSGTQSHHEDKVAVNTLIQKIDDVRRFNGRILVIFCTNRYEALDPAILRRASFVEEFSRPTEEERRAIIRMDCEGLGLSDQQIDVIVQRTGVNKQNKIGFTFSDIRTRLLPEALAKAYPSRKITNEDILSALDATAPSPSVHLSNEAK